MKIKTLSVYDASKIYFDFVDKMAFKEPSFYENLNDDYKIIRNKILELDNKYSHLDKYDYDLQMALDLYTYFLSFSWFNTLVASNDDFWIYIAMKVMPDIIYKRFGLSELHFYKKSVRVYPYTLWWYIHYTYQGDITSTYNILKSLNTDYIFQLVERRNKEGQYINVIRKVFYCLGTLPKEVINKSFNGLNLLRRVSMLHTMYIDCYNLEIEEKEGLYVEKLFRDCGVELNKYGITL